MHQINPEQIARYMNIATADLREGRDARGEALCQIILDYGDPNHPAALNGIGAVAWKMGIADMAHRYFQLAADASPQNRTYQENLANAAAQLAQQPSLLNAAQGPRLLLSKAWGMGFWSDVDHVLGCLLLSELTHRIPVVHWGDNSLFSDNPNQDAWRNFFFPVSNVSFSDFEFAGLECFPPKWAGDHLGAGMLNKWRGAYSRLSPVAFLNRSEPLVVCDFIVQPVALMRWIPAGHPLGSLNIAQVYRYLIEKYLRPVPEVAAIVDAIAAEHFTGRRVLAVHLRGSDKRKEMEQLDTVNRWTLQKLDELAADPDIVIFALTDSHPIAEDLMQRYGQRVLLTRSARSTDDVGVHYKDNTNEKTLRGREVMIDTYLAARADYFIGNGASGVSAMIEHLKDWPPGALHLMAPNTHYYRNFIIYGTDDLTHTPRATLEAY